MSPLSWRCQPWEHRGSRQGQEERDQGDSQQGFTLGICQNQVCVSAQRRWWWHRAPMSLWHRCPHGTDVPMAPMSPRSPLQPLALPAGMGTGSSRHRKSRKQPGFGAGIYPPRTEDAVGSSRKGAEQPGDTSDTEEFAAGISHALPGIFPLWRDLMGPRKEHGSLMSSKARAKAADPSCSSKALAKAADPSCSCPSRTSPARKAVPRDGQSQLSFPKPSGEQVRAGR